MLLRPFVRYTPQQTRQRIFINTRSINSIKNQILIKPSARNFLRIQNEFASSPRFYTKPPKGVRSEESFRARQSVGPATWRSLALFLVTGLGLLYYFKSEKDRLTKKREEEKAANTVGKPKIGGEFELINQDGRTVSSRDFLGRFMLVYFGFTHCPDICPAEMEKMSKVVEILQKDGDLVTPILISCDPQRDTPEVIKEYLKDFHKDFVGLTGTIDQITKVAKDYRVYFSKPPDVKENEDYLVDHSIFFYLMDPNGEFVAVYGKNDEAPEVSESIKGHIKEFVAKGGTIRR